MSAVVFLVLLAFILLTTVNDRRDAAQLDFSRPHLFQSVQNFSDVAGVDRVPARGHAGDGGEQTAVGRDVDRQQAADLRAVARGQAASAAARAASARATTMPSPNRSSRASHGNCFTDTAGPRRRRRGQKLRQQVGESMMRIASTGGAPG